MARMLEMEETDSSNDGMTRGLEDIAVEHIIKQKRGRQETKSKQQDSREIKQEIDTNTQKTGAEN